MIAVRQVVRPIGIGIVWRDEFDASAVFCNSPEFGDEIHHVRDVFDRVARDDEIELVVGKWIWKNAQIVNHVGTRARVVIESNRAFVFVVAAPDIENFHI